MCVSKCFTMEKVGTCVYMLCMDTLHGGTMYSRIRLLGRVRNDSDDNNDDDDYFFFVYSELHLRSDTLYSPPTSLAE